MSAPLTTVLRRLLAGNERIPARRWHAEAERQRHASTFARREAFLRDLNCKSGSAAIKIGRAQSLEGPFQWCGLPLERLLGGHSSISGASGSGKTFLLIGLILQLLRRGVPTVIVDYKSELSTLLTEIVVPALVAAGREGLLELVRVVRPFESRRVPLLRLTEPELRITPQVQAMSIAQSLNEAVGRDSGLRMLRALLPAAGLAVERNLPLPIIGEWLRSPEAFAREAASSSDPMIRSYALHDLPREPRASLDALRARLALLLYLPQVREALSAPRCIDFGECLNSGVTVLDFGSPPGGAEAAMKFIAGPVVGRLGRAILSREVEEGTPAACVIFEEVQEGLEGHAVELFKRLLALARFKRVSLAFSNQQPSQIAEVDRTLLKVLDTNTTLALTFRSSVEDARVLSAGLSIRAEAESLAQARSRLIEEIATLPRRSFFCWLRDSAYGPQRLQSPRVDLDALRAAAGTLTEEQREHIRVGCASMPRTAGPPLEPTPTQPDPRLTPAKGTRRRAPRLG